MSNLFIDNFIYFIPLGSPTFAQSNNSAQMNQDRVKAAAGHSSPLIPGEGGAQQQQQYSHFAVPGVNMSSMPGQGQAGGYGPPPPLPGGQPPPIMARHNREYY